MNSSLLLAVANHLWQSTLFAAAVACLTLLLRSNSARIRCLLWLAASAKFLVPFALLTAVGAHLPRPAGLIQLTAPELLAIGGQTATQVAQISAAVPIALARVSPAAGYAGIILIALEVVWALGTLVVAAHWFRRWQLVRRVVQKSTVTGLTFLIPVRSSAAQFEPAIVGVLNPVLLLPEGMEQHLAPPELDAVLAHERCHVLWQDNLTATVHMLVEAIFWFHPLVWWLGRWIVDERERACDERVLAQGYPSRSYAEAILKVCERYLQSPLTSAAGVGGGHLSRRIEAIMQNRMIERLGAIRKSVLTLAACATFAIPLAIGALTAARAAEAASADSAPPILHNVSIKLAPPPEAERLPEGYFVGFWLLADQQGIKVPRVEVAYPSLRGFVAEAYGVDESQVMGKDLSKEPKYQIRADDPWPESPTDTGEQRAARFMKLNSEVPQLQRELLATHFGLKVKRERRQMPGYVLTIAPGGSKLDPDSDAPFWKQGTGLSDREIITTEMPVATIVRVLERMFQAPVIDQTGLKGTYDYKLTWAPPLPGTSPEPSVMARSLEEQLGLHLEAKAVTVDVINVISLNTPEQVLTAR